MCGTMARVPEAVDPALIAAARTLSDLTPFLVVMAAGFLLGAWGGSARSAIAVIGGILLILIAVVGFILDNSSGSTGIPGLPG